MDGKIIVHRKKERKTISVVNHNVIHDNHHRYLHETCHFLKDYSYIIDRQTKFFLNSWYFR